MSSRTSSARRRWSGLRGSRPLVPVEDPQRAKRVPTAGFAVAILEREVDGAAVRVLKEPRAAGLSLRPHELDRFGDPRIGTLTRRAEVVERAQHVVMPPERIRELEELWVD